MSRSCFSVKDIRPTKEQKEKVLRENQRRELTKGEKIKAAAKADERKIKAP